MTYRFDDFVLNPATRELRRNGVPVVLPARAFDCLAYLIEHRERAVGRDELIAAVWGRVEISDALLGHTIVKVRRSLGDTGNEQRGVRTVPRFGYRWVLPVDITPTDARDGDDAGSDAREDKPDAAPQDPASIADSPRNPRRVLSRREMFALAAALLAIVGAVACDRLPGQEGGTRTGWSHLRVHLDRWRVRVRAAGRRDLRRRIRLRRGRAGRDPTIPPRVLSAEAWCSVADSATDRSRRRK